VVVAAGVALAVVAVLSERQSAQAQEASTGGSGYSVTELGTLGGDYSQAFGINSRGQIVGSSYTASGEVHAFLWEKGEMTDLGTLGGDHSQATAINSRGQVVGYANTDLGMDHHAVLWSK
jgi:probable HAF family extracellular repeat protein